MKPVPDGAASYFKIGKYLFERLHQELLKTPVFKKIFGSFETAPISLQQFFTISLIKKGGGLWPDETLATSSEVIRKAGANSISDESEKDKSDA